MCLGLHFAYMQVKILLAQMLPRYRIELAAGDPDWQAWPIPKPKDGVEAQAHRHLIWFLSGILAHAT